MKESDFLPNEEIHLVFSSYLEAPGKSPLTGLSPVHQAKCDPCSTDTSPNPLPVTVEPRRGSK